MSQPEEHPPLPVIAVIFICGALLVGASELVTWGVQGFPLGQVRLLMSAATLWLFALLLWLYRGSTSLRDNPKDLPNARWKPLMYPIGAMMALYLVLEYFVA
ncbi:MAG: hypothetical protein WBG86_19110 [Polyangiales bacterium]